MRNKNLWIFLAVLLIIVFIPRVIWQFSSTHSDKVVILDKTVQSEDKREHLGITWILQRLKFSSFKGEDDYYGYFPEENDKEKPLPRDLDGADIIYAADTYGIYEEMDGQNKLLYGGLKMQEWQSIREHVEKKPSTLIMEFNTFASPTEKNVQNDVSGFLDTSPTGWTGRAFADLSAQNEEITNSMIDLYETTGQTWDFEGAGFVLLQEEEQEIVVLSEENGDLAQTELKIQFTDKGTEETGMTNSTPYTYWFDITETGEEAEVWANYHFDLSKTGNEKLETAQIPTTFPAIIHHQRQQSDLFYFAGDFADVAQDPTVYKYTGFENLRAFFTPASLFPEQAFFWKTYVPLMKTILQKEYTTAEEAVAATEEPIDKSTGLSRTAKLEGNRFEVYRDEEWVSMPIKGVNIGMGVPGAFPGEAAITEQQYYDWFKKIGEMNANTVRVYTIHPPGFYHALSTYNQQHSDKPIYVLHGVWIDEGPLEETLDAFTPEITEGFQQEMERIVDVVHGNATLEERRGHASGVYSADVSPYILGWVIGIEWYPYMVDNMNQKYADMEQFNGSFMKTENAQPMEIWLAQQMDHMMEYERANYNWIRPMSFTNWVTTDLLDHPAEPLEQEDLASVNPNLIKPKGDTELFASYHVYPYYPDALNLDSTYTEYIDSRGNRNNYAGYLHQLQEAHNMPILVAEYGIPASRGKTHENPFGWNQGFISEEEQGEILQYLYTDILEEGMMGGLVFTWQDEWFKRTWNTMELDNSERRPYWSNAQTNEQQFGLLSFDRFLIQTDGKLDDWSDTTPLYQEDQQLDELYVTHDERYLYVQMPIVNGEAPDLYFDVHPTIGSDTIEGISFSDNNPDFVLKLNGETEGSLLIDAYYDAFNYQYGEEVDKNFIKPENNSGQFNPILLALNRELQRPDTEEILPFSAYETGKLKHGNSNPTSDNYDSLADYYFNEKNGVVEVRIPWLLLQVKDPSTKQIMGDIYKNGLESETFIDGIGIAAVTEGENGEKIALPAVNEENTIPEMKKYTWENWDLPKYEERLKQSYYIMQERFGQSDE